MSAAAEPKAAAAVSPQGYLSVALQRLDVLLHREILRLRSSYQLSLDEFRGLYVSDEQVNQLIDRSVEYEGPTSAVEELTQRAESLRATDQAHPSFPWQRVATEFSLSQIEQDILLLAVAPEIDLKYETLFAYLNNDVTRKWPTFDLAVRVCSAEKQDRVVTERSLQQQATLFSSGLLQHVASPHARPSWLSMGFSAAPGVSHYLSGGPFVDPRLARFVEERIVATDLSQLPICAETQGALRRLTRLLAGPTPGGPIVILSGRHGSGRESAAQAVCHELGIPLMRVDLAGLHSHGESASHLAQATLLQQRLRGAGLYLTHLESSIDKDEKTASELKGLITTLARATRPVFIGCTPGTNWGELLSDRRTIRLRFDDPDFLARVQLWKEALAAVGANLTESDVKALAHRFSLTPGQISSAAVSAADSQVLADPRASPSLDRMALFEAARAQSDQSLGRLAVKVRTTTYTWEDLVLPRVALQRVQDLVAAIQHRHVVYTEWGFARRVAAGQGLKVLFSGASGTGKTMTASVIASDLGLDLYKIDLASVVSKYIGETEKNLDKIFRAAHSSNAILFFDEADALFGKRSEVKDAHDRYANIEVAYLLQKIEEYEGVVILASNLSKNIDEAFPRRMHYVVEFPLPDENHRERLWRGMFPSQVPLGDDVDFLFLARQFVLAGGDIRNVALDAAFLAARDGRVITMHQLVNAMARQLMKQGRIVSPSDFKQYHALVASGD